ncbi:MAG: T9SS type A sorting domain-containing protein, partial [Planctomycetota bacterium]
GENPVAYNVAERPNYPRPHITTVSRPGCGITIIPAGGLLNIPESSSGCTCNFGIQTSMALLTNKNLTTDTIPVNIGNIHVNDLFLSEGYPNPFNASTNIRFSIPGQRKQQKFSVVVYNVHGQVVRTLVKGTVGKAGIHNRRIVWSGMDDTGIMVGSGVYFYRLTCGTKRRTGSIVMIK